MHKHCRSLAIRVILSIVAVLGLNAVSMARMPAQRSQRVVTIVVKGGSPVIKVNGKDYVPGTSIKEGAKIEVSGSGVLEVGGAVVTTDGGATLTLAGSYLQVITGTVQVAQIRPDGTQTTPQTMTAGESVRVQTETIMVAATSSTQSQTSTSETTTTTTQEPPPNNPKQNLSPSSP